MSAAFAKHAIEAFLVSPEPDILCVEGRWGTGKSFTWNNAVSEAVRTKQIARPSYSYVSRFGINNSDDIIQSVFANSISTKHENLGPFSRLTGHRTKDELKQKLKKSMTFAAEHASIPHIAGLGGVARALLSNFVKDTIICIDDFERRNKSVSINDVMGIIVQLRDAKNCKIALLLNENSLDENEKAEFQRLSEKVFNRFVKFLPTPAESAGIVFRNSSALDKILRDACEELEIINIRVLEKIKYFAYEIAKHLGDVELAVTKDVMRSLVVLVASIVSPVGEGIPSQIYINEKYNHRRLGGEKSKNTTPEEDRWYLLLQKYGFGHIDDWIR